MGRPNPHRPSETSGNSRTMRKAEGFIWAAQTRIALRKLTETTVQA